MRVIKGEVSNNGLIIILSVFAVFIVGLIFANTILLLRSKEPAEINYETSPSSIPIPEQAYSYLESLSQENKATPDNVTNYCRQAVRQQSDAETIFGIQSSCSTFLLEHERFDELLQYLSTVDTNSLSDEQLATIYKYYQLAYSGKGDKTLSEEYEAKYKQLREKAEEWT